MYLVLCSWGRGWASQWWPSACRWLSSPSWALSWWRCGPGESTETTARSSVTTPPCAPLYCPSSFSQRGAGPTHNFTHFSPTAVYSWCFWLGRLEGVVGIVQLHCDWFWGVENPFWWLKCRWVLIWCNVYYRYLLYMSMCGGTNSWGKKYLFY